MGVVDHCTEIFSQQPEGGLEHRNNTKTKVILQLSDIFLKNKEGNPQLVSIALLWAPGWMHCHHLLQLISSRINSRSSTRQISRQVCQTPLVLVSSSSFLLFHKVAIVKHRQSCCILLYLHYSTLSPPDLCHTISWCGLATAYSWPLDLLPSTTFLGSCSFHFDWLELNSL